MITLTLDGFSCFTMAIKDRGQRVTFGGFRSNPREIKEGDHVLIRIPHEDRETRYIVEAVRIPGDPPDQYFMECKFAPRTG